MNKNKKQGFMITEALIVSTFVTAVLIYIFIQLKVVMKNYNHTFSYNTVNGLYATNEIINYLSEVDLVTLSAELEDSQIPYLDISNCRTDYIKESNYCISLLNDLKVYKVYFTKDNIEEFKKYIENLEDTGFDNRELIEYIKTVSYNKYSQENRLIVWFLDDTFASVPFK